MSEGVRPREGTQVQEALQRALAADRTVEVVGGRSKRAIGRPLQTDLTIDLSALTGITLYEPEELVLSARAGTTLAEIEAALSSEGQQLAFEPMDCGPILGSTVGPSTIGGVLASNLSGPRRVMAGAARDHLLGFTAVSGRGETFKSGGRVVKNVTGYDLSKLMAGSWGTLAVLTDVTLKTLPRPESEETILIRGLEPSAAISAMANAMASSTNPSAAAHVPAEVARCLPIAEVALAATPVTLLRLEGFAASMPDRRRILQKELRRFGDVILLDAAPSRSLWKAVRNVTPFAAIGSTEERPLWRLSTAPSRGAELAARICAERNGQALFDWAGGLVWIRLEPCEDAGAAQVHRAIAATGGHALLIRASPSIRAAVEVFSPQEPTLAALTKRVKESFDPKRVLNPGRMWAGV
jgi:glycolate oxidase FAD binding subunit